MISKHISLLLFFVLIFPFCSFASDELSSEQRVYLEKLVQKAKKKELYNDRYWDILLHYKETWTGSKESQADYKGFFNSPDGKTNPKTELLTTLKVFFEPYKKKHFFNLHPQCRFKGRYEWLKQKLEFNPLLLPEQECLRFEKWIKGINPGSVTMIFPNYNLITPGSMFGHTLLRINKKGKQKTSLLDYSINYAAGVDPDQVNAFDYVLRGILGGYVGNFSIIPYYEKIQEYSDIENRDLWEYNLTLTEAEIRRMLFHAWELKFTYFDYYFFDENCSYHLLSLLEAARPSLKLKKEFKFWTIPSDTIRVLLPYNLVESRTYRPSRLSKVYQKMNLLNEKQKELFAQACDNPSILETESWNKQHVKIKALILEMLSDYYIIQATKEAKHKRRSVLRKRAKLKYILPKQNYIQLSTPPEEGHESSRTGLSLGTNSENQSFLEYEFRFAFHDLLDNDHGHLPNSQVDLFKPKARIYNDGKILLEELSIVDVYSITPKNSLSSQASWKAKAGLIQPKNMKCSDCNVFSFNGGYGATYSGWGALFSVFADGMINYSQRYEKNYQAQVGLNTQFLTSFDENWKLKLVAADYQTHHSEVKHFQKYSADLSYTIDDNLQSRLFWRKIEDYRENGISLFYYF